jgi:hypothetical protein
MLLVNIVSNNVVTDKSNIFGELIKSIKPPIEAILRQKVTILRSVEMLPTRIHVIRHRHPVLNTGFVP